MQQQFGVFQLVLAQLLARNNPGDPLINLLNPAPPPPAQQQDPQPVQHAPALSESQGQSHVAPAQQPLPDDVTRHLDSLEKLVAKQRGAPPPHHNTDSIPHPLNTNITLEPYPAGFKIPQLETYDGTKDLDDHLHAFYSCMQAQNAFDALMCKIFPSTLRGNARCYYSLPPRSISSSSEMASAFAIKFSSKRLIRKTTFELMGVKQRDGESLKNYMSRFNDAVLEVISFNQAVGIAAVTQGLQHERFRDSLIKYPATTFNEVNDRSLKFITAEEYALSQKPVFPRNQNPDWRDEGQSRKRMKTVHNRGLMMTSTSKFGKPNSVPPQQNISKTPVTWTPFNLPRSQIFMQIKNKMDLRRPGPMRSSAATHDHTRYCDFHQGHGHTTEQCNSLRSELESLAQKGMLNEYIQRTEQPKYNGPTYGFNNQPVQVEGVLTLLVAFGSGRTYVTPLVRFLVVKMTSSFNVVISRPTLTEIRAVVSQSYLYMKFPTPMGIATLRVMGVEIVDNRPEDETRATPVEDVEEMNIDDRDPSRKTQIGTRLSPKERAELIAFLRANNDIIKEEVEKLLQVGFVRRVDYCEWVANPVLDQLVEATSRNERLSLLDAYSSYHQVSVALEDEEKTSFYAGDEIYCYVMMPFGLKNAGATYQKMVTIIFRAQINKNLEVYVDDIVVKSLKAEDHLADLNETFNNLRKNRMRIEVNPKKIRAIAEMEPPKSVKDIQRLTGKVAALHRFIWKAADKCLPFFKIMRSAAQKDESSKQKKFEWNQECQAAFDELKSYLNSPPLLTKAIDGEILYLYLGISNEAISSVLVKEEGKHQKSIYYISSVLRGAELRYPIAEKATLAVVTSARKLRPYFQSHPIIILTDQPLRQILQKPECSRRLIKWAVELGEFEITFQQRSAIRAQALADFIVECTPSGAFLIGPNGYRSEHALKFNFDATNNMAKYEALQLGLQLALELKVMAIQVYSDSQLVVNQVNSICEVVDPVMMKYVALVAELKCKFQKFCLNKIPQTENEQVDSLSKFASDSSLSSRSVSVEVLDEPSFMKPRMMEAEYTLREVHEGVCGSHIGARNLAHKVLKQGYYWPNILWLTMVPSLTAPPSELQFTSVYHPKSNGMVESVNKSILKGIKPRLEQHKVRWADVLNNVLWAYRTTSQTATVREEARLRTLVYKQKLANFYHKRVRPRTFKVGDLVLRKADLTGFETHFGKLAPNWEGPYTVAEVPHPGAYVLQDAEGKRVPRV
ncbi:hypothetical protein SLEP1_g3957 [Rubroshorea leprosula]|uniref:Uncharacterized protein n=1 Tax=Rubroshorea leprosula TaxID=152421 RepID=A0AAV5HUQ7_9ROSI|nr:hypothetical protein SLEP1_g3957 [Rubroshorea leprosula]